MRALNAANMLPPLLHLTHYILRDTVGQIEEPVRPPGSNLSYRQRIDELRDRDYGKPRGWGIVVDIHVAAGEVIGEYVGELIRADDAESASPSDDELSDDLDSDDEELTDEQWSAFRIRAVQCMRRVQRRMYKMRLREGHSIQPHLRGNWTRFINHSTSPNVRYEEWLLPTGDTDEPFKPRVAIITTRAIKPGEELFADYNAFHSDEWISPDDKLCGPRTTDDPTRACYSDERRDTALGTLAGDVL
jgi:hypothetical protein